MELMTKKLKNELLKAHELMEKEGESYDINDKPVIVKYFHSMSRYTFYAIEGKEVGDDIIMFGYVLSPITPDFDEYGYVSLNELKSVPLMERDLYFQPKILKECL